MMKNLKKVSLSCAVLSAAFFLLVSIASAAEMVSIKGNNVNMRSGPGHEHEILWRIGHGFPLRVIKKTKGWVRVKDFEGSEGWVSTTVISHEQHAVVRANKGTDQNINVRSRPDIKSDVVATAIYGVVFRVLDRKGDWVKVQHENGVKGWVRQDLLWGI